MNHEGPPNEMRIQLKHSSITSYIIGFLLSLVLTFSAYFLVTQQILTGWNLILTIAFLGILQMIVQLLFFLHMGVEKKPRWNLQSFLFMALVVVILVSGSLWIMYNLDTRVMPEDMMNVGTNNSYQKEAIT